VSRHYHDSDCTPSALEGIEEAANRIADTLDDYIEMTLAIQDMTAGIRKADPAYQEALQPLLDIAARIRARREAA
jgi:hypothetical protein